MQSSELTETIIGAAHKVLYALKPGLDEKLYERALVIELTEHGLSCDVQRQFPVHYAGQHIGTLVPDLIVNGAVIVDTKVVTGLKTSLLLNFKHAKLGIKRVSN